MAYDPILLGTVGNDHTGDPIRTGGGKINTMLAELYMAAGLGITPEATANLAAGDFVHVYGSGGDLVMELADATDATKPANGFILEAVSMGDSLAVYPVGAINSEIVATLTVGADYWLDVGGGLTATPLSTPGQGSQYLGFATAPDSLLFQPEPMIGL